jgi:hypothetical protein
MNNTKSCNWTKRRIRHQTTQQEQNCMSTLNPKLTSRWQSREDKCFRCMTPSLIDVFQWGLNDPRRTSFQIERARSRSSSSPGDWSRLNISVAEPNHQYDRTHRFTPTEIRRTSTYCGQEEEGPYRGGGGGRGDSITLQVGGTTSGGTGWSEAAPPSWSSSARPSLCLVPEQWQTKRGMQRRLGRIRH